MAWHGVITLLQFQGIPATSRLLCMYCDDLGRQANNGSGFWGCTDVEDHLVSEVFFCFWITTALVHCGLHGRSDASLCRRSLYYILV